jgi:hypothetical protein
MARSPIKPTAVALSAVLVLSACANVEIDIDVYKGPLANHQDMQVQQLAAMTVAALPLLVGLRDELAVADIARALDGAFGDPRRELWRQNPDKFFEDTCGWGGKSWVRKFDDASCNALVRERAERVNAIIGLYESKGPVYTGLARQASDLRQKYLTLLSDARYRREAAAVGARQVRSAYVTSPSEELKSAFEAYVGVSDVPEVSHMPRTPSGIAEILYHPLNANKPAQSANQAHEFLERDRSWHENLKKLFSRAAPVGVADKAIKDVQDVARDFRESRETLEILFLRLLDLYQHPGTIVDARKGEAGGGPNAQRVRAELAGLIGLLVQGEHIALILDHRALFADLSDPPASATLLVAMPKSSEFVQCIAAMNKADKPIRPETYDYVAQTPAYSRLAARAGENVARWLTEANDEDAIRMRLDWLRKAHATMARYSGSRVETCSGNPEAVRLGQDKRFKYGLVRGPSFGDFGVENETAWANAIGATGLGLEDGRHERGLIERIEAFLKIRDGAEPAKRASVGGLVTETWPLLDAVGDFATKVAFLADNDSVFAPRSASTNANVTRYNGALQAVANQLIVQIDEIRRRESHRERHPGPAARQAAAQALAVSPPRAIAGFLSNLDGLSPAESLELRTIEATLTEMKLSPSLTENAATTAKNAALALVPPKEALRDRYRTDNMRLSVVNAAISIDQVFDRALGEVAADTSTPVSVPYSNFADAVTLRVKRPALPTLPLTPEAAASAAAIEWLLADLKTDVAFKSGDKTRANWVEDVRKRLPEATAAAAALLATATKEAADLKASADAATKAETLAKRAAYLRSELTAKNEAHKVADAARAALIQVYADAQAKNPPIDAWATLKADLRSRAEAGAPAGRDAWKRAADVADAMNPPSARDVDAALAALPTGATALDTFDALIQNLRFELVETTRRLGADSPQVKSIQAAIDTAYEQRSGMAYIRPPAAFLRMVNAASAIQPDPGLGAENRLQRSFWRSLPLIGSSLGNLGEEENLRVRADIDRQNWQNINRVRLDGAGRTNYALVKDDIGNWYAKGYEADTTKIVDSMRGLAMFNLGPRLPGLTPASLPRTSTGQVPAAGATVVDQSQMGRALSQFREAHAKEIEAIYENVRKLSDSIVADAKGAVDSGIKLDTGRNESLKTQFEGFWRGVTPLNETPLVPKDQDRATFLRKMVSDRLSDLLVFRTRAIASARNAATVATTTAPPAAPPPAPGAPAAPVEIKYSKPEDAAKAISDALSKKIADELSRLLAAIEKFEREAYVLSAATKE